MIGKGLDLVPEIWRDQLTCARELPGRGVCGVQPFMFSCGLLTELRFFDEFGVEDGGYDYAARYCYPNLTEALAAIATWDGQGDPPGPWIKEKISERLGPGSRERRRHG